MARGAKSQFWDALMNPSRQFVCLLLPAKTGSGGCRVARDVVPEWQTCPALARKPDMTHGSTASVRPRCDQMRQGCGKRSPTKLHTKAALCNHCAITCAITCAIATKGSTCSTRALMRVLLRAHQGRHRRILGTGTCHRAREAA